MVQPLVGKLRSYLSHNMTQPGKKKRTYSLKYNKEELRLQTVFFKYVHFLQNHSLVYPQNYFQVLKLRYMCEIHVKTKPHKHIITVLLACMNLAKMSIRCQVGQYQLPHLLGSQSLLFEVSLHLGLEVLCLLLFTNLSLLLNCLCLFFLHSAGKERRNLSETTGIPQRHCGFGSRPLQ